MVKHKLICFKSPAHHDILMFGAVAEELLALMGVSGRVPSALAAEDIPAARAQLVAGLAQPSVVASTSSHDASQENEDETPAVPLSRRAIPLLALLDKAYARQTHVLWEAVA